MTGLFLSGDLVRIRMFALVVLAMWLLEVAAVCVDFWAGTNTARALGQRLYSNGFRRSFAKMGDYWRVTVMFLLIDLIGGLFDWYTLPFATILVAFCVIGIEIRSVIENARAKKSQAAKIPETIRAIIQCSDVRSAEGLLKMLGEIAADPKTHETEAALRTKESTPRRDPANPGWTDPEGGQGQDETPRTKGRALSRKQAGHSQETPESGQEPEATTNH